MNRIFAALCAGAILLLAAGCSTLNNQEKTSTAIVNSGPMYEDGKGRADMTLAIWRPEGVGLLPDEEKYLGIIQGALNSDFHRFSAIQLFDQMNLQTIIEQHDLSLSGHFSDSDFISINELVNSRYILAGTLTKTGASIFTLNLSFTEVETGNILISFQKDNISLRDIVNSTATRAAVMFFLSQPQIGVVLTEAGRSEMEKIQSAEELEAQTALSLSYEASINGNLVDALIYSYAASSADKNLVAAQQQAENTFNRMGGAATEIKDDIRQQAYWKDNLIAFEKFYREHTPFELYYTSVPVQKGFIEYENSTVDLEFTIGMRHNGTRTMQKVLNDILKELKQTNAKKNHWGFDNWPLISAESTRAEQKLTSIFNGYTTFTIKAVLLNNYDEVISTIEFPMYGQVLLKSGNNIGASSTQERKMTFTVAGALITDNMQIRIASINGIDADKADVDAYLRNTIVGKLPAKSSISIPKDKILIPLLPEEIERQNQIAEKKRTREAYWNSLPLTTRKNVYAAAVYNPNIKSSIKDAFSVEFGFGGGYKNFSMDGRVVLPITPVANIVTEKKVALTYGLGLVAGYSYLWEHIILGLEGGFTYYKDSDSGSAIVPVLEGRFDFIPGKTGTGIRLAYKMEFDGGMVGSPILALVKWW